MKALLLLLLFAPTYLQAQTEKGLLAETDRYVFYGHYWLNMHHFFQQESMLRKYADTTMLPAGTMAQLSEFETKRIENTIQYYLENLVEKDLQSDEYMQAFKEWIITQNQLSIKGIPAQFRTHCFNLIQASLTYRSWFWETQHAAIKQVIEEYLELIASSENVVSKSLAKFTKSEWKPEKIRVDICYVAKSSDDHLTNQPYTTLDPTHLVMHVSDKPNGNWLELLYHESTHHLINPISGEISNTISEVAATMQTQAPKQLSEAYLSYFTGKITQEILETRGIKDYELYIESNEIFSNYFRVLDKYLPKYMSGNKDLYWATTKIIQKLD